MTRKRYKNEQEEILHHEILKQSCIYTYSTSPQDLPIGYQVDKTYDNKSGLYVTVLKKDNDVIIAIRGTEQKSLNDWNNNAQNYLTKNPSLQTKETVSICQEVKSQYPNAKITVTGHSAGGGNGAYAAAKTGLPAVTFNPIGTADLVKKGEVIDESQIINYCNPRDWTPSGNGKEHLGKCYEIDSKPGTSKHGAHIMEHHKAEYMQDLRTRKEITKEELTQKYKDYRNSLPDYMDTAIEAYKEIFGIGTNLKNQNQSSKEGCVGSYSVSGYTRSDGIKVGDYTRSCGAKHSN